MRFNRFERCIHRPVSIGLALDLFSGDRENHAGLGALAGFAVLGQGYETILLIAMGDAFIADEGKNVLVKNFALAVCKILELDEGIVDVGLAFHCNTEFLKALLEGVSPTQLAQHDLVGGPAHVFGAHDFVGVACLQHAILVNARRVGKRVGAHDGFVGLHHKTGRLAHQATGRQYLMRVNAKFEVKVVLACFHSHHHLFKRTIARTLAQAVDGAFHLPGAADLHACE